MLSFPANAMAPDPQSPNAQTTRPKRGKSPARQLRDAQREEAKNATRAKPKHRSRHHPDAPPSKRQSQQAEARADLRKRTKEERLQRYRQLEELRTRAIQAGLVEHGLNPVEVLQRLIDDAFIAYALAQTEHDALLTQPTDQKVIQQSESRVRALRREAAYFAGLSVQYNLQDRQTKVQEARLGLMVNVLQRVLRHPDIDLPADKVREIPRLMQQTLITMRYPTDNKEAA